MPKKEKNITFEVSEPVLMTPEQVDRIANLLFVWWKREYEQNSIEGDNQRNCTGNTSNDDVS
jgi:hypothetical protein